MTMPEAQLLALDQFSGSTFAQVQAAHPDLSKLVSKKIAGKSIADHCATD
jgi:hypothetical protein